MSTTAKSTGTPFVLVISSHMHEGSAAYRRINFFVRYLKRNGVDIRCMGMKLLTAKEIKTTSRECLAYSFPLICSRSSASIILNTIILTPLILIIVLLKPKILIISVPDYVLLIPSYIGGKLVGARFIIDVRDPPEASYHLMLTRERNWFVKILLRVYNMIMSRADMVTAVTEKLKESLERTLSKKVVLIPNGADLAVFRPLDKLESRIKLGLEPDAFIITYIGVIGNYYDLRSLLTSIRRILHVMKRKVIVLLAGPVVSDEMKKLIRSKIYADMVKYMGEINLENLITVLSAADVGVIPRVDSHIFDYAVPAKFYEYIALGLPVLALCNENSELWRLVSENSLGYTCRPDDKVCIERSLEDLMSKDIYLKIRANVENYRNKIDRTKGAQILLITLKRMLHES